MDVAFAGAVVVGLVMAAVLALRSRRALGLIRQVTETRTTRIADLGPRPRPLAEVSGVVRLRGAPVVSPVSGRPCAYYEVVVDQEHPGRRGQAPVWRPRLRARWRAPFDLDDGTGRIEVPLDRGEVRLDVDRQETVAVDGQPSPALARLLGRRRIWRTSLPLGGHVRLRCRETVLAEGDALYALGAWNGKGRIDRTHGLLLVGDGGEGRVVERLRQEAAHHLGCAAAALAATIGVGLFAAVTLHEEGRRRAERQAPGPAASDVR